MPSYIALQIVCVVENTYHQSTADHGPVRASWPGGRGHGVCYYELPAFLCTYRVFQQYAYIRCAAPRTDTRVTTRWRPCEAQGLVFKAAKVKRIISALLRERLTGQKYDPVTGTQARRPCKSGSPSGPQRLHCRQ